MLVGSVNHLNAPFLKHIGDFINFRTPDSAGPVTDGAAAGMNHIDALRLKPVQLFQKPLILLRIRTTAVAVEVRDQNDLFLSIPGKALIFFPAGSQTAGAGASHGHIHAGKNCDLFHIYSGTNSPNT